MYVDCLPGGPDATKDLIRPSRFRTGTSRGQDCAQGDKNDIGPTCSGTRSLFKVSPSFATPYTWVTKTHRLALPQKMLRHVYWILFPTQADSR